MISSSTFQFTPHLLQRQRERIGGWATCSRDAEDDLLLGSPSALRTLAFASST